MSVTKIRIALDAMGGDLGPQTLIQGAFPALEALPDLEIILVGKQQVLQEIIKNNGYSRDRLSIVDASEVVEMGETPKESLKKRHSSIAVATKLVKERIADGLVSAGNTGSTLAHTLTSWRTISGIKRPAVAALLPTNKDAVVLIDAGANVDCRPENLLQFAIMGSIYAQKVLGRQNPRVGLLSIGEELSKGNRLTLQAQTLLAEAPINFQGNAEGRDVLSGNFDVIVCDGFVGNVLLKFGETAAELILSTIRHAFANNPLPAVNSIPLQPIFKEWTRKLDYAEYGGAPLLGVNGVAIVSHGQSTPKAIMNAIRVAYEFVVHRVNDHIREEMEKILVSAL